MEGSHQFLSVDAHCPRNALPAEVRRARATLGLNRSATRLRLDGIQSALVPSLADARISAVTFASIATFVGWH